MKLLESIYFYKSAFSLLTIILLFSVLAFQNPFDIKSRQDKIEVAKTNNSSQTTVNNKNTTIKTSTSNPFDIKKEPNRQKSKSPPPKESKQNVNKEFSKISKQQKLGILLAFITFFVLVRNINHKGFSTLFQSFTNQSKLVEFKNSFNGFLSMQLYLFYLFFFTNVAYFIYLCIEYNEWQLGQSGYKLFLYILGGIIIIYFVKYTVLTLIEYALEIRRSVSNHLFSISVHNILLGFSLFFVNAFFAFTSGGISYILMLLGLVLILLIYLIRQLRGLAFLSDLRHFSMLHFFIYLCGCEISPLIVAVKFITG